MSMYTMLKESENCLYLVHRKPWFVFFPDSLFENHAKVNVGQYDVEEIYCESEDEFNKSISNFSYILEDDNNALLTNDRAYAYYHQCLMNKKINEIALDEFYSVVNAGDFKRIGEDVENHIFLSAENLINKRRGDK